LYILKVASVYDVNSTQLLIKEHFSLTEVSRSRHIRQKEQKKAVALCGLWSNFSPMTRKMPII